jgi:hypothetical protein
MPHHGPDKDELPRDCDPARHYENAEPWTTRWQCRFIPPNQLGKLDVAADRGLQGLLYLQTLISEEIEISASPAKPAAAPKSMAASSGAIFY